MLLAHLEHRPEIETALLESFGRLLEKYREHPPAAAGLPGAKAGPRRRFNRRHR
jgi:hypothetical protein